MIVAPSMGEVMQFGGRRPPGLIRRPGARGGNPGKTELQQLEDYLAKVLFSWMRADYRAEAGGKVTQFTDKVALPSNGGLSNNARSIDPAHAFAQAIGTAQVVAIAGSGLLTGREAGVFANAQYYDSTLPLAPWKFLNDGSVFETISVFAATNTNTGVLWATMAGTSIGAQHYASSGTAAFQVWNATSFSVNAGGGAGSAALNTGTYSDCSYGEAASPQVLVFNKATGVVSAARTGIAPTNANPTATLRIGAQTNASTFLTGHLAELMFANKRDATLRAAVQRYLQLRYFLA